MSQRSSGSTGSHVTALTIWSPPYTRQTRNVALEAAQKLWKMIIDFLHWLLFYFFIMNTLEDCSGHTRGLSIKSQVWLKSQPQIVILYPNREVGIIGRPQLEDLVSGSSLLTTANCRPIFPMVIPPEKKMQGSHDRTNRKSGAVYLEKQGSRGYSDITRVRQVGHWVKWILSHTMQYQSRCVKKVPKAPQYLRKSLKL